MSVFGAVPKLSDYERDADLAELRRLSELKPEPVETVTSAALTPDEIRDASRTAHEALGLEPAWPCAKCKASFERNTGLIKEHLARVLTPEETDATIKRVADAASKLTD